MGLYPRGAQTAATLVILIDGREVVQFEHDSSLGVDSPGGVSYSTN